MTAKRYLDQEGLQTFWTLIKEYIDKKTEITVETKPVYYQTDGFGNIVYNYDEAHGLVQEGVIYYERQGSGTDADPYVYVITEDELLPGIMDADGYYTQGEPKTTTSPTEDELNYPVIDPETGEQKTTEVAEVDPETEEMIMFIIGKTGVPDKSIPNEDILVLWS